ncbi:MAG: phospholipase D-like domain-containing protein [Elusimicrobiota bacterium]
MTRKILILCSLFYLLPVPEMRAADATDYIKVFFNQPESALSPSKSEIANPTTGIDDALADFLETARSGDKVYLCFYDMDNTKVINAVNTSLVAVGNANMYMIYESTKSTSINNVLENLNITKIITDGTTNSPLMHNKFAVIIDAANSTGRVWTGSYNPTDNGTTANNNNAVWIESYSLAQIYEAEFLYMYNSGTGKFSTHKSTSANTAKSITAGNDRIDVYFSPYTGNSNTDTSMVLEGLIDNATHSVFFSMFEFSNSESRLKTAVKEAHQNGLEVKGIVEAANAADLQSELSLLGLDVVLDANDGLMHHKFCVIDYGTDHPKLITGSYNWTPSARDTNDENFLVIHSAQVAKLFWEEFQKNYSLARGGTAAPGQEAVDGVIVYPSPVKDSASATVGYELSPSVSDVKITFYTLDGAKVFMVEPDFYPGTYNEQSWGLLNDDGEKAASGLYVVKVEAETGDGVFFDTAKFAVIR